MPNLPWVEAIKAEAEAYRTDKPMGRFRFIANAPANVDRLLRAVEVLGEAVETAIARMDNPDGIDWKDAADCLRRALADVREG